MGMSMADPFLPIQPASRSEAESALEPEDFDHGGESDPEVSERPAADDDLVTENGEPPVTDSVFNTPDGHSVDPARDD